MAATKGKASKAATSADDNGALDVDDTASRRAVADADDSYDGLNDADVVDGSDRAPDDDVIDVDPEELDGGEGAEGDGAGEEEEGNPELDSLFDDGEEDEEEEEGEGEPVRDEKGRFAGKDAKDGKPDAQQAAAGDKVVDGKTVADPAKAAAPTAPEPVTVKIDKQLVTIDEAKLVKANGHHLFVVPDDKAPQFVERMRKGIAGEKMWRQLVDGLQELEARKNAPAPRSDVDIESEIILEAVKPHLAELFDERDLENLKLKIQLAQRTAREEFDKAQHTAREEAIKPQREQEQREATERAEAEGLAEEVLAVAQQFSDKLEGLDADGIKAAYGKLFKLRGAVYRRDGDNYVVDRDEIFDQLRTQVALKRAGQGASPKGPTASAGQPKRGTTNAERFNRGVNSGGKPGTTSLKAGRGKAADNRPRGERTTRDVVDPNARKKDARTAAMVAEDKSRASQRKWMSSATLDIGDDEDEE